MGFTRVEGLAMATRSGSVDPGLLERSGLSQPRMAHALEHESGMLALAGTADMRTVIQNSDRRDLDATLAPDLCLHRLRRGIAAMAAAMGGLDILVRTGGVSERAPAIRARTARGLSFLGVHVDQGRNQTATGDCDLTGHGATVGAVVVTAREDLEVARQARRVLA
jgi:acetate kinase